MESLWQSDTLVQQRGAFVIHFSHPSALQRNFDLMRQENLRRKEFHLSSLARHQREILESLPLLFHLDLNFLFPGWGEDPLIGISGYHPSEEDFVRFQRLFRRFRKDQMHKERLLWKPHLEYLYLMGSAGTLAFSEGSDMDFWVGIEKKAFKINKINRLEEKARRIEIWANETAGMELHFFLTDTSDLRKEDYGELDAESCGSAQGKLLKDEFYRSMIHLAGKYPKFWATPLNLDDVEYAKHSFHPAQKKMQVLDIGNAHNFSRAEIFGGVLWQILKGLHSPLKSVLKIALLEYYVTAPNPEFLCNRLKRQILEGDETLRIDPYLEMITVVRDFLRNQHPQTGQAQLQEECFLIKCTNGIDMDPGKSKFAQLLHIASAWGISKERLLHLRDFRNWDYEELRLLADRIFTYFIQTYMKLRQQALQSTGMISERDLTVMGKTLRAYLQKSPTKVQPHFSLLDSQMIHLIRLARDRDNDNKEVWVVLADFHGGRQQKGKRLYQHEDLFHVCAWLVVNHYYHPSQKISIYTHPVYSLLHVTSFLRQFHQFLPQEMILDQVLRNWDATARLRLVFLIPNSMEPGQKNLLASVEAFTLNSFGEVHQHRFQGPDCLDQMAQVLPMEHLSPGQIQIYKISQSNTPQKQIEEFLEKRLVNPTTETPTYTS